MMQFPQYESYRNSDVPWIGNIPSHWQVKSLRSILENRNEKNSPVKTEDILSLSIANGVTPYSDENRGGNKAKSDLTAYKLAYPDDIVLNSMNVIVGAVGLSKYFGAISPVYYALYVRNKEEADIYYYDRIFSNTNFQKSLRQYGKGILIKKSDSGKLNTIRMKISAQDLKKISLPLPPVDEQKRIAKFLDKKTAGIDDAIAKKQKLIGLLQERKAILINQIVTRGLNPNVPTHDSGNKWIGEMPEHWKVCRLKTLIKKIEQGWSPQCFNSKAAKDEWGVLKVGCVNGYRFSPSENKKLPPTLKPREELELKHKEILISRANTLELVGSAACALHPREKLIICDKLYRVKVDINKIIPEYLILLLQIKSSRNQIEIGANGASSSMQNIGQGVIKNLLIALPNIETQEKILAVISKLETETRKLVESTMTEIEKLHELKEVIISNAVTGKMKI